MRSIFSQLASLTAPQAASALIGCQLQRRVNGEFLSVRIVETECYDPTDPASHSFRGMTVRNRAMFGAAGHAYVYFTYGMHYCMNVVVGPVGYGAAVLIRAAEPLQGLVYMKSLRPRAAHMHALTNGPAKLCQALAIDRSLDGHDLRTAPLTLISKAEDAKITIARTPRIGISKAKTKPWRFYEVGSPYVSVDG